ncbi:hypothetical protein GCM10009848_51970 [Micromonospora lupini]
MPPGEGDPGRGASEGVPLGVGAEEAAGDGDTTGIAGPGLGVRPTLTPSRGDRKAASMGILRL